MIAPATPGELAAELRSVALLIRRLGLDGLNRALDDGTVTFRGVGQSIREKEPPHA